LEGRDELVEALDLLNTEGVAPAAIPYLLDATRDLADQAQALALILKDISADEALLDAVNDLAAFFWTTEERIEAKLGLSRE
jgi:hypothetical protein